MLSSLIRYSLYGVITPLSLISTITSVSAAPADGVFGDYFRNIISTPCANGYAIIGFDASAGTSYGTKTCRSIADIIAGMPGNIGIGTTTPSAKLEVAGDAKINGVTIGKGLGNIASNTALGGLALSVNTTGNYNVAVGLNTLISNTTGYNNTALGSDALFTNTLGYSNTAVGKNALYSNTLGYSNTALGMDAMYNNTLGYGNTALGYGAGSGRSVGANNIAIGYNIQFPGSQYGPRSSNQLSIGDWIYGDNGNIGIGTSNPAARLDVAGNMIVSGTVTAPTFVGNLTGNASTASTASTATNASYATTFSTTRGNYKGVTDNTVAGQLMWKNYGNGHTIFDASAGTSPDGTTVNQTNANYPWLASYPTLMGWNGGSTFGLRVDSARTADSATAAGRASGTSSTQFFLPDSDESWYGPKSIHANSNLAGFLNGQGSWMVYWDHAGNQQSAGNVTASSMYTPNWFRSTGVSGWYSETYGGGVYMNDTTFVRTYGNKAMAASSYYDQDNMGFYLDPHYISKLNRIDFSHGYDFDNTAYYIDLNNTTRANSVMANTFFYISDNRLKKNIVSLSGSLDKLLSLNGYEFDWINTGEHDIGVIAQEVEQAFPDLVRTDKDTGMKSVKYGNLVAPIIEAIKEVAIKQKKQDLEIENLKNEIIQIKKTLEVSKK